LTVIEAKLSEMVRHARVQSRLIRDMTRPTATKTILALSLLVLALGAVPAGAGSAGTTLPIAQAPYVVSVNDNCTGTLISPTRILTAGHCLDGASAGDARILVGVDGHLASDAQRAAAAVPVRGYAVDPKFKESFPFSHNSPVNAIAINDVGLILLKKPITTIAPVRVAGAADAALEAAGTSPSIIGYGDTAPVVFPNPVATLPLQQGAMTVIGPGACADAYPKAIQPSMLCTEDLAHQAPPFVQACAGDSGGPIVEATPSGPVQIGITSWGPEVMNGACGQLHLPNVSMRASSFSSFINDPKPVIEPFTLRPGSSGLPRAAAGATIVGATQVGHTVTCKTPKLGGDPATLSYTWGLVQNTDRVRARGQKLKITAALYKQASSPRRLFCTATARNAGGTLGLVSGSDRLQQ
jgi:hypothetical protein